jgi:competence protein ComGC
MIKFFRKVRYTLMSENKTSKYFKYAIVEIVLVVIGILIALQINNWNEKQKDIEKEQQILLSLREEFKQNIKELEFDHALNKRSLNAIVALMNFDHTNTFKTTTIDSLLGQMYNYATFDARLGVMNDITSSGNLELIRDSKLKYALNQWSGELDDYKEDIIIRREYWVNNVPRILYKFIPLRNVDASMDRSDYRRNISIQPKEVPKENYVAFLSSLEVDSMLFDYYMNQSYVTVNENAIMKFLKNTLSLIEANIKED